MSQSLDLRVSILDAEAKVELKEIDGKIQQIQKRAAKGINLVSSVETRDASGKLKGVVDTYKDAADKMEVYSQRINNAGKVSFSVTEKSGTNWAEKQAQAYGRAIIKQEELGRSFTKITASVSSFASLSDTAFAQYSKGVMTAAEATEQSAKSAQYSSQTWQQYFNTLNGVGQTCGVTAQEVSVFGQLSEEAFAQYSTGAMSADAANESLRNSTEQTGNAVERTGNQTAEAANRANKASKAFGLLHTIFLRLAHTAISQVTRAFRQSFTEMQNVDKQLTTVSRITQTSISNLDGLKEKAYEVGSAYGVMASDYLSGVAAFTRAGYREQAEDLAELSTKLQVAGEVSAETANQLLIATDKAYGLNGSVTDLSSVMDKMTYVDHNYATSVEKIAEGMGIVAPVAAQAHMSVDELIASLGTITAVTQRSGSESARALRALILSIIKDTTTELEDGVTMTVDEVNSVQDALKKYAPEVVAAAEATGELIDPMEAIAALSKSFEEGILTEQKLAEITSSLGGKLRASQLLSLIQNFSGMYTDMMNGMGNAMGIVDKDTERYLESWQGKLTQLKNSFSEFTESLVNTSGIKDFIDALNFLIQAIDNPEEFGDKFISSIEKGIENVSGNLGRFQQAISRIAHLLVTGLSKAIANEASNIAKSLADGSRDATDELAKALPDILKNLFTAVGKIVGQSIADSGLAFDITTSIVEGIISSLPSVLSGLGTGLWDAIFNATSNESFEDAFVNWLGKQATRSAFGKWLVKVANKYFNGVDDDTAPTTPDEHTYTVTKAGSKNSIYADAEDNGDAVQAVEETAKSFDTLADKVSSATEQLSKYKTALEGGEKGDALKSYAEAYNKAVELFGKGLTGTNAFTSAIDLLFTPEKMRELGWNYEKAGEMLSKPFFKALFESGGEDFGANAANYIHTHQDVFEGVVTKVTDGKLSLMVTDMDAFAKSAGVSADALYVLLDALGAYNSAAEYTREELLGLVNASDDGSGVVINLSDAINKLASDGKSSREIHQIIGAIQELAETDPTIQLEGSAEGIDEIVDKVKELHEEAENGDAVQVDVESDVDEEAAYIKAVLDDINGSVLTVHVVADYHGFNKGGGGGGGGNLTRSNTDTRVYASGTKSSAAGLALVNDGGGAELISANGKAWIAGGGEPTLTNLPQGATVFNAKQTREILTRSGIPAFGGGTGWIGGIPLEGKDILGGKKLTKNLEKILDELSKYIDDILKKAKKALDKQLKAIDEQIEALEREHDAEEDKNKLEELRLKILEAEKRLEEAKNERTVRYFNKETGQWEWMADQKAVHDAEQALKEAQEAYDKEVAEQEYQAKLQELKDQKDALQKQYDDLAEHWEEILEAIQEAGEEDVDFEEILKKLGLSGEVTDDIRKLIEAILNYEKQLTDGTYEIPLDNETANRIMGGSVGDGSSGDTLTKLIGLSGGDMNAKGTSIYNSNITNTTGDVNYYINGLQIGSDMMDRPLSEILSRLSIYAN